MAWLSQFKLGIPGEEVSFELNPAAMSLTEGPVMVINENLSADILKDIPKNYRPTAQINSNYLTLTQKNQFINLACLPQFLSFQYRDDNSFVEQDTPDSLSAVTLRGNSITLLDKALNDIGGAANITITGVYTKFGLTGTNYYSGGSYDRDTRAITLGAPLATAQYGVFVAYTYLGWLCNIRAINTTAQGGWVDRFQYDFSIEGA